MLRSRVEVLGRDKHSSLFRTFVNYGPKKVHNIGPLEVGVRGEGDSFECIAKKKAEIFLITAIIC